MRARLYHLLALLPLAVTVLLVFDVALLCGAKP